MKLERVIEKLASCSIVPFDEDDALACKLAIQALQEKLERENPKPLTLEELKNMDGEPVWVMHFDGSGARWGIVKSCDYGLGLCAVVDDETACCGAYWFSEVVGTIAYRYKHEHIGEATNMIEGE